MRLNKMWALVALGAMSAAGCASDDVFETRSLAMAAASPQLTETPCDPVATAIDPSLVYADLDRLQTHFQLREVLETLLERADVQEPETADALWSQWWLSNQAVDPDNPTDDPRCGDGEGADRNGFPIVCDRQEDILASRDIETHQPVQLVNRFDLMPLDGSHCGEYRIVYAMKSVPGLNEDVPAGENLVIFEGVVPNPDPGCGAAGCRPIVDFWARLSEEVDADVLAQDLRDFYFEGLPEFGVQPVVRPEAYGLVSSGSEGYSSGTGQIRTNQFVNFFPAWTLREYGLETVCTTVVNDSPITFTATAVSAAAISAVSKKKKKRRKGKGAGKHNGKPTLTSQPKPATTTTCKLIVRPQPVAMNPFVGLFDGTDTLADEFQAGRHQKSGELLVDDSFIAQLGAMIPTEPNGSGAWPAETLASINMATAPRWDAAESIINGVGSNLYEVEADSAFFGVIEDELPAGSPYEVNQIVARATMIGCAGCHQTSNQQTDLGNDVTWPIKTPAFTHVNRFGARSNVMDDHFLPHRMQVMGRYLAKTCEACLDKPLLRDIDGEFLTAEDLDLTSPDSDQGAAFMPSAPPPALAKDVIELGGKATLSGSLTH